MKRILISSFDMEVGGVERSLLSMLSNFDYENHEVDLMLYSHTGDFMKLLPPQPKLLKELPAYKTFRLSIGETIKKGNLLIGLSRLFSKLKATRDRSMESGYKQMQYMWKYSLQFLPKHDKEYDVAISYLWPHYFVASKVQAKKKIAWIHTDYSTVETDIALDLQMWNSFHYIVAVSEECRNAFLVKYPTLCKKVIVLENITSPGLVKELSKEKVENPLVDDNRFKIVTVARLSHAKGIDNAIKALKILKAKGYEDIAWYIVGYGGDEAKLRNLIKSHGLEDHFILLGKKINPYPFIKEADLYVQPSRYEGKAVTVGEAQILGKPVLITNYPTARSQIQDAVDGLICDLSIEGLADSIELLYHNPQLRNRLSQNCQVTDYDNLSELDKLYQLI
ncbi:glycosyltransferase [Sutcliffiella horikoshii]|uniref:glycosyltransferase n=1 Tax=Sutcliffiella horikoshii TaxID=79883 RepID=UPI001CBECE17|nr:glycosyltransferase [Sutcliffiella horikoshii]UAL46935.1 glycosyltransferase [Sutcliffiella horikoshii]